MAMRDNVKWVMDYLTGRFEKGKFGVPNVNFIFKCNDIPNLDNRVVGKILKNDIAPKGFIELRSGTYVNIWQTCFNGGD